MTELVEVGGRYFVTMKELGRGGFCQAQLAEDIHTHKYAVVRQMKTDRKDIVDKRLFKNGIDVQSYIDGRFGLPTVLSHEEGRSAVDYVEGKPLGRFYKPGEEITLCIAYQVVSSVDPLHKIGVVHRDLTPLNIIVTPNGRTVPIDYDTAHMKDGDMIESVGTNGYMSPEQALGIEEDGMTDIFAIGSTIWRIFTGRVLNSDDVSFEFDTQEQEAILSGVPGKSRNYYRSRNPFERFCYQNLEAVEDTADVGEVIETCWRVGRTYESAEHMKVEVAERLKKMGINPKDSRRIVATWARDNVISSP